MNQGAETTVNQRPGVVMSGMGEAIVKSVVETEPSAECSSPDK